MCSILTSHPSLNIGYGPRRLRSQGHAENLLKHVLRQKFGRLSVGDFLYVIAVMYTARAEQGLASLR